MKHFGQYWRVWALAGGFTLLLNLFATAQDIHFSQPMSAPLYLNPSLTGFSNNDFRVNLSHRSQWRSVSTPYQSLGASFDAILFKRRHARDVLAAGIVFTGDRAGDSEFGTTCADITLNYIKALGRSNRLFWGLGIRAGYLQRTIDYDNLRFDQQYNGLKYDENLPSGENFSLTNFSITDFAAGTHVFYQLNHESNLSLGYSIAHLTRPDISLLKDYPVKLPFKHVLYGFYERNLSKEFILKPTVVFQLQDNFRQALPGITVKQVKISNPEAYRAFSYGVFTRAADAAIIMVSMEQRSLMVSVSYDFNYSRLRRASVGLGGYEVSLQYVFNRGKTNKIKPMPCPMF